MKIAIVCLVLIILLAIVALIFIGAKSKLKLDIGQAIMALSTLALVIVTGIYVGHTYNMVKAMRQTNQLNFRPYVMIEELPTNIASSLSGRPTSQPIFYMSVNPQNNNETFFYYLKNIGKVEANEVELTRYEVREIDPDIGDSTIIQVSHQPASPMPIFPNQALKKVFQFGQNVVFREAPQNKQIQLTLHFNYRGVKDFDPNRYYTEYSWVFTCATSPEDPQHHIAFGGMDQGIEEQ